VSALEKLREAWATDRSWYPPEAMILAAVQEMVATARARGITLDPWVARVALVDERHRLEAEWSRRDAAAAREAIDTIDGGAPEPPTAFARATIAKVDELYPLMKRSAKGGRVTVAAMARRVGIDRGTIPEWVLRGWMTWPPKNPQN
jgi:hypothetical protein